MWLIAQNILDAMDAHRGTVPTAEQQRQVIEAVSSPGKNKLPRGLEIDGDTAVIAIHGVLTKEPDFFAWAFGGGNTTYAGIIEALEYAEANPSVSNIQLHIDSPGGSTSGLFQAMAAVAQASKPVTALVDDLAASAAYGLASQANEIVAVGPSATVGSIGIATSRYINKNVVDITSSKAPFKRVDASTEEGRKHIQEGLDALHDLFAGEIARGRGVSADTVNTNYGRGDVFLAGRAKEAGMIDRIITAGDSTAPVTTEPTATTEVIPMDLATLKAQHPAVYQAAMDEGIAKERKRVVEHAQLGQQTGAMKTALEAIEAGIDVSGKIMVDYVTAGLNRNDQTARDLDELEANHGVTAIGQETKPKPKDERTAEEIEAEQVAALLAERYGIEEAV